MKKVLLVLITIMIFTISSVCYADPIELTKNPCNICITYPGWNDKDCLYNVIIVGYTEKRLFMVVRYLRDGKLRYISTNNYITITERP